MEESDILDAIKADHPWHELLNDAIDDQPHKAGPIIEKSVRIVLGVDCDGEAIAARLTEPQ